MKISLVEKSRSGGKKAIYLRYYRGYYIDSKGRNKQLVKFENLNEWKWAIPKGKDQVKHNNKVDKLTEKIETIRKAQLIQEKWDIKLLDADKADFLIFYKKLAESKQNHNTKVTYISGLQSLTTFTKGRLTFGMVNDAFAELYTKYLMDDEDLKSGTAVKYFGMFKHVANQAYKKSMSKNPILFDPSELGLKKDVSPREFLTKEEISALISTPHKDQLVKDAFLFCCFVGIRYSEVLRLSWKDIEKTGKHYRIKFKSVKTKKSSARNLPDIAVRILKTQPTKEGIIFDGLTPVVLSESRRKGLRDWAKSAGINKHIVFHSSRHSMAINFLMAGGTLYSLRNLLQHSSVTTTERYLRYIPEMDQADTDIQNDYWS